MSISCYSSDTFRKALLALFLVSVCFQTFAADKESKSEGSTTSDYGALSDQPGMAPVDAISESLRTNPEILAEKSAWRSEDHAIRRAEAGYFPVLDVRANAGWERTRENFRRTDCSGGQKCRETKGTNTPSVNARQPVFDGFRALTDVARAEREKDQAGRRVEETQELISFRAVNAFIDVRRFQRLLRLSIANAKAHRKILAKVNTLIQGGKATIADRAEVKSRLADAESAVTDIEGDLGSAVARFIDVVGREPDRLKRSVIPEEILPKSLEEALKVSAEKNRSLLLAQSNVAVAKAELDTTEVPFWPTVDVELDARRDEDTEGRKGHEVSATALVVLRYNIFNGGADTARRKEVNEQVSETRHRQDLALRNAEREVRVSWAEMKSAMRQSETLRISVDQKEKVIQAYEKQFDLGTRSLLDLLNAWNEFFLAKGSLITVDATSDLTGYRLLSSMGVLLTSQDLATPLTPESAAEPAVATPAEEAEVMPVSEVEVSPPAESESSQAEPTTAESAEAPKVEDTTNVSASRSSSSYTYDDPSVGQGIYMDGELISGDSLTYD